MCFRRPSQKRQARHVHHPKLNVRQLSADGATPIEDAHLWNKSVGPCRNMCCPLSKLTNGVAAWYMRKSSGPGSATPPPCWGLKRMGRVMHHLLVPSVIRYTSFS